MSEPLTVVLNNSGVFDGSTAIPGTKTNDFEKSNRTYSRTIEGGGVVPADFWGMFREDSPKVVGVSARTGDPNAIARVVTGGDPDNFREQLDMRPLTQHVLLLPNDTLSLLTIDRGVTVELLVNELSESQHQEYARVYPRVDRTRRFRIKRGDELDWAHAPTAAALALAWTYDATRGLNVATTTLQGPVRLDSFFSRQIEGVEAWVRFSAIDDGTGEIFLLEGSSNRADFKIATGLDQGKWSGPHHLGFDDMLGFTCTHASGNSTFIDIEFGPPRNRRALGT